MVFSVGGSSGLVWKDYLEICLVRVAKEGHLNKITGGVSLK